jgi:hypothetical protein
MWNIFFNNCNMELQKNENYYPTHYFECIYDICLVWASALQAYGPSCCHPGQLADRFAGVLLPGAGQPDRQPVFLRRPVENDPGSHNPGGVCRVFRPVPEGILQMELCGFLFIYFRSGFLHVQEVLITFRYFRYSRSNEYISIHYVTL